jgi:hypothetical protein
VYNRFARGADLFADPEEAIESIEQLLQLSGEFREANEMLDGDLVTCDRSRK